MYQQIFVPTQQHHSVELPDEFYGKKIKVIAFPLMEDEQEGLKQMPKHSMTVSV